MSDKSDRRLVESHAEFVERIDACEQEMERAIRAEGQVLLGWRDVPTDNSSLGPTAVATEPFIRQCFIERNVRKAKDELAFERKLYVIRKRALTEIRNSGERGTQEWYMPSVSCRTIVYKGMLMPAQVDAYYPELRDPDMESALALVHSRFSTNTFPSWERSHPYRYIAHNGEINTLRGNINWMRAREGLLASSVFGDELKKILPVIREGGSDTATFDNTKLATGASATVTLDGAAPSLKGLTFNTSGGGFTLATGTGGSLTLKSDVGAAAVTATAGTHVISTGLALKSATGVAVAGGSIEFSGVVSGLGQLTKTGAGTLVLSGANTFEGGVVLSEGTLIAKNSAGLGVGNVVVGGLVVAVEVAR